MHCENARLRAGKVRVEAKHLSLDRQGGLQAGTVVGVPCACGSGGSWISFSADQAWVARAGRRLHLRWPTLRLGGVSVLPLPYLALPLARGVSGLFPTEVGYGGRDGVRLHQSVYLAAPGDKLDLLLRGGWIQERGGSARLRLRAWQDGLALADLTVQGVADPDGVRGALRGVLRVHGRGWSAGVAPDLISDGAYLSDLGELPERVFAPHLRSRIWAGGGWRALYAHGAMDLIQSPWAGRVSHHDGTPVMASGGRIGAAAGLLPVTLWGPLRAAAGAEAWHHWTEPSSGRGGRKATHARSGSAFHLSPQLNMAGALSVFSGSARATYHLVGRQGILASGGTAGEDWSLDHLMEAAGEISIPLARTTTREKMAMRHVLEPHLGLVWTPLLGTGGSTAAGLSTRPPLLLRGGFASAGLRTRLHSRKARDGSWMPLRRPLAGEVRLLWPLPGEGADEREPMLAGSLTLSLPPALHGKLRLLYRPESNSLAHLEGDLCLLTWGAFQPCAGYRRLRLTGAMELWAPDLPPRADTLLWLDSRADQVYGGLRLRLGPVRADVLLAVDPELRQFSHASAAMQLVLGCGCYRVGFQVATRAGQRWPDLGAQFTLQTPGAARCLGRRNSGGGPAR